MNNELGIKKVIITGASGGPGQALVRKLLSENIEILLIIRKESGRSKYFPKNSLLKFAYCDLAELSEFRPEANDYDVFIHLGWDHTHPVRRVDPHYQHKNIEMTLDAVDLAFRAGCRHFIGCGSQAEYGIVEGEVSPSTPCFPVMAYGMAKLCANQMSRILCEKYGMKFNWVRVLSVYGPVDNPGNIFISTILNMFRGEELKFTKGEQVWDLLYTGDLAEAFWAIIQRGKNGSIYTVGSGIERTLREEIEVFIKLINPEYKASFGEVPYSENQVMYLLSDNTDITRDTGWRPTTSLEDGARLTIDFWKKLYDEYGDNLMEMYFKAGGNGK